MCKKSSLYRILGEDWSSEKKEEKKILVAVKIDLRRMMISMKVKMMMMKMMMKT